MRCGGDLVAWLLGRDARAKTSADSIDRDRCDRSLKLAGAAVTEDFVFDASATYAERIWRWRLDKFRRLDARARNPDGDSTRRRAVERDELYGGIVSRPAGVGDR